MGFCPILVGSTGISKQCPRHIPFETIVTVAVGNDSFDLCNRYQTSKNAPHFLGFLPCHFLLGKRCGGSSGDQKGGYRRSDLGGLYHLPESIVKTIRFVIRVHGISGINGYREFNRLLELVRTMPG